MLGSIRVPIFAPLGGSGPVFRRFIYGAAVTLHCWPGAVSVKGAVAVDASTLTCDNNEYGLTGGVFNFCGTDEGCFVG